MESSDDKTNITSIERIPIIILGNQNDSMEQIFKTSQHPLSTIMLFQYQLRNWALKYHSSIMFISCKTGENLDLFKSYLIYIAFNATATIKPNLSSFKSLFIPFEYDSIDKIEKLKSEIKDLNISHNISDCFELNQTNDNISYYDIKYQAIPNDKIKIIIEVELID
ncbi:hypothetical protein HZS_2030 [Henneguya salminicola]|nr:hypothetical protein HZS_2030 [Henneguya salminicola]